jgi:hypothetical protein
MASEAGQFSRGQVQVLYSHLPGALFTHHAYNVCRVTSADISADAAINVRVVLESVREALARWDNPAWRIGFPPNADKRLKPEDFMVGPPRVVMFAPFPDQMQCQRCLGVFDSSKILSSRRGVCPRCAGILVQFRFVQAHNCGRLAATFLPSKGCERHGFEKLFFDDTGRVVTARWRCRGCNNREIARLRQGPCQCVYAAHASGPHDEGKMRLYSATDPAVFRSRVAAFVNFRDDVLRPLESDEASGLVFARIWGILDQPVKDALEASQSAASQLDPRARDLLERLAKVAPDDPAVADYRRLGAGAERTARVVDDVRGVLALDPGTPIPTSRGAREHVAILDQVNSETPASAAQQLLQIGDVEGAGRLGEAATYAHDALGVRDIRVLDDFPIGLCAYGFMRVSANPHEACLNAFPAVDGRTPLYTIATKTEAIYCQLNESRVVAWLLANRLIASSLDQPWSTLYRIARIGDPDSIELAAIAVRSLLHTISHTILRNIELSGYSAQSIGEYLLPEGLAFVVYANRHTETKIGGLLTLFQQRLLEWLRTAQQSGRDCAFDPFCGDDGGACVGCLHREHNCPAFNAELSRALLYGGNSLLITARHQAKPLIRVGYWCMPDSQAS